MGEFRVHRCRFYDYQPSAVHCIVYSELTDKCAVSRADGSVEIWSVQDDWYQERVFAPQRGCSVESLVWCADRLFSAGLHCQLHEYNLDTGQHKSSIYSDHGPVWCMVARQNASQIAVGTEQGCVVIYDVTKEGLEFNRSLDRQEGRILCIAWHEAERMIVTGGEEHLRVWSTKSGHAIRRITLGHHAKRKETIVWAVAVTSDFTIITGDSLGKTCFWNGYHGTLIKAFQCHKEAVLTLCLSADNKSVFSAGVDPTVVQFERSSTSLKNDRTQWVKSTAKTQHEHDVRALALTSNAIVSAGVDCQLVVNQLGRKRVPNVYRFIHPIPQVGSVCVQHSLLQVARQAGMVLLRYSDSVELWRLGSTTATSEKSGQLLPLATNHVKLVQLRCREGEVVLSSAVSHCASWLAYSDSAALRLFHITLTGDKSCPQVSLDRVRHLPDDIMASQFLSFSPDGSTLLSVTTSQDIQLITMSVNEGPTLKSTLPFPDGMRCALLVTWSGCGRRLAVTDQSGAIHVYKTDSLKIECTLPRCSSKPTALTFHPSEPLLLVVHADMKLVEYDLEEQQYTDWGRRVNNVDYFEWKIQINKITHAFYHPHQRHLLLLASCDNLWVIDKHQDSHEKKEAFHLCTKFKFLMHADVLEDGFLVLVEQPPLALLEALPPVLKKKHFGT